MYACMISHIISVYTSVIKTYYCRITNDPPCLALALLLYSNKSTNRNAATDQNY